MWPEGGTRPLMPLPKITDPASASISTAVFRPLIVSRSWGDTMEMAGGCASAMNMPHTCVRPSVQATTAFPSLSAAAPT